METCMAKKDIVRKRLINSRCLREYVLQIWKKLENFTATIFHDGFQEEVNDKENIILTFNFS